MVGRTVFFVIYCRIKRVQQTQKYNIISFSKTFVIFATKYCKMVLEKAYGTSFVVLNIAFALYSERSESLAAERTIVLDIKQMSAYRGHLSI